MAGGLAELINKLVRQSAKYNCHKNFGTCIDKDFDTLGDGYHHDGLASEMPDLDRMVNAPHSEVGQ
jgi:hypothetical protein